jgi:hypothetical protein
MSKQPRSMTSNKMQTNAVTTELSGEALNKVFGGFSSSEHGNIGQVQLHDISIIKVIDIPSP